MNLPNPSPAYNPSNEAQARRQIEEEDARNRKIDQDIELRGPKLILRSPNGNRWEVLVSDAGVLSASAL